MADIDGADGGTWVKAGGREGEFVTRQIAGETLIIPVAGQVGSRSTVKVHAPDRLVWALASTAPTRAITSAVASILPTRILYVILYPSV